MHHFTIPSATHRVPFPPYPCQYCFPLKKKSHPSGCEVASYGGLDLPSPTDQ